MSEILEVWRGASARKLAKLISERLESDADKPAIDSRIWRLFGESWAIMYTDLVGFSRRVDEFGIIHFLQIIHESHRLLLPCVHQHDGLLLKHDGDSTMLIFRDPASALDCAFSIMQMAERYSRGCPAAEKIEFCIGIGYGKVLRIGEADVFGAEVNAACKLGEDAAKAREILITGAVHAAVQDDKRLKFQKLKKAPSGAKSAYKVTLGKQKAKPTKRNKR